MKYFIDGVVVVEGKNDASYLSSFIDTLFVTTNGYEIPNEEVKFLNQISKIKKVIILTDPDDAGKTIRNHLFEQIPNAINVEVDLAKCDKKGKHGVAECDKNEVVFALKNHFSTQNEQKSGDYSYLMDIDSDERKYICKSLNLGICNQKTMLKRISALNLSDEEINVVRERYHGNK